MMGRNSAGLPIHAGSPAGGTIANPGRELLILSATVLFLELAIIRWGGVQVRVLAYFPNLLLVASFLGLGLGCLRAGRRSLAAWWMPSLALLTLVLVGLGKIVFTGNSMEQHLWLLYYDLPQSAPVVNNIWLPVLLSFCLTVLCFVSPGQLVAERLRDFQFRSLALRGYGWDLAGSFLGATLFSLAAFQRLEPLHWFMIVVISAGWLERRSWRKLLRHVVFGGMALLIVGLSDRAEIHSPYYSLSTRVNQPGTISVLANGSLHQVMINQDPETTTTPATTRDYAAPYTLSGHRPRNALVLGAGTGNDVAVLLRQSVHTVDAVEIDPEIINLGRRLHPNRPYDDPRVTIYNTDARAFLNHSTKYYDTIVFGTLDSMTRLSALSNVRLDNFVYTTNCLEAARQRLTDDGGMLLYFMLPHNFIDARIEAMIMQVFGDDPAILSNEGSLFNQVFMAGPAFAHLDRERRARVNTVFTPKVLSRLELPEDDWPFLYLARRSIGSSYRIMILALALLAIGSVLAVSREFRKRALGPGSFDAPMFFFGFAFLLLETRAVTAMNLVWGTTWLTNAVVFGAVLLTVLAGTLGYARFPIRLGTAITGLSLSLLALYVMPTDWLLTTSLPLRTALSCLAVGLPVLFASAGFAEVYATRRDVGHAFGWNLLGAVAGGLAESLSMILGLRALLLLALAAYLVAYFYRCREHKSGVPRSTVADFQMR